MNPLLFRWLIAALIAAGLLVGALTLAPRPRERDEELCTREPYGVDYETCVQCIGAEPYCHDIWVEFYDPTPTPSPSPSPTADPLTFCQRNPYGTDYATCVECINSPSHCTGAWGTPSPTSAATPMPSPQSSATPRPSATPGASATPASSPTSPPSPSPSLTPTYDCDGGYGGSYEECMWCAIVPPSYCASLFR